ncbi:MAG: oxygenase MpaB family protein [Ketobacteraceae bacterium]|nr:oxygenase MpaB family protein [Ketobacteraceae bacterium]
MGYTATDIISLQKSLAPAVYGDLDLTIQPERFRTELGENSIVRNNKRIRELLADKDKVEFFRQLTLMGDPLADAFAALIPDMGFRKARDMIDQAAVHGIDSVKGAPPELVALMASMENEPDWVDWDSIESASKNARMLGAAAGEAVVRVAFMMTYVNGYQGLPMVITGALTSDSAAKRMKETVSTFKLATLPGALRRGGVAYQSAVKVRVMHAMVRTNLLRKPEVWDYSVYGVPIPQVDQMGAALAPSYMVSLQALKKGGHYNEPAAALVEQARYLAHLLGMHEQFLSNDPRQIVETWQMCQATLRHQHDPRGRDLNTATLQAWRRHGSGWFDRLYHNLDVGATRFLYEKIVGRRTANAMGVTSEPLDFARCAAMYVPAIAGFGALSLASRVPGLRKKVEDFSVQATLKQLAKEGEAEYKTDESRYRYKSV